MPTFSVCIPSYNAAALIEATIDSVLRQTYQDFEILVVDDNSTDATEDVVTAIGDKRIRFFKNDRNLGLPGNFRRCRELAGGQYIYLLGNDDILSPLALERTLDAFHAAPNVAVVTRPYYWFQTENIDQPVRLIPPLDEGKDRVIDVRDGDHVVEAVLHSIGQITGLAFKNSALICDFDDGVFTTHVLPFLETWRDHKAVFLKDHLVAVRIVSSQTRRLSSIYRPSPVRTWIDVIDRVFPGDQFRSQRRVGHRVVGSHIFGLIQVRCYGGYWCFWRESLELVKAWRWTLLMPAFWMLVPLLALLPRNAVISLVDIVKPLLLGRGRAVRLRVPGG